MDIREDAARFYDFQHIPYDDVPFYLRRIASPKIKILELGCGTGRVLIPLSQYCAYIHGIDISEGMLTVCREKLAAAEIGPEQAQVTQADITTLDLNQQFDLIIAPFRVFQNLTEDKQIDGFFDTIHRHLAPGGSAIINTFRPNLAPDELVERNGRPTEMIDFEVPFREGTMRRKHFFRRPVARQGKRLVFFPTLIYQYYRDDKLVQEAKMEIAMRVWYPDQLLALTKNQGFQFVKAWGGYQGEPYGQGQEQIIQIRLPKT